MMLLVFRFFLVVGLLGAVSVLWDAFSEWHARVTWPAADGKILSVDQRDSKGVPGSGRYTNYWLEYRVRFAVPREQCLTGTVVSVQSPFESAMCEGRVRTRATRSTSTIFDWLQHAHPRNSGVRILHDPSGPGVRIAGESPWLTYRWDNLFLMLGWNAVFLALCRYTKKRLCFLEALPEGYDAFPPPRTDDADRPVELKLT